MLLLLLIVALLMMGYYKRNEKRNLPIPFAFRLFYVLGSIFIRGHLKIKPICYICSLSEWRWVGWGRFQSGKKLCSSRPPWEARSQALEYPHIVSGRQPPTMPRHQASFGRRLDQGYLHVCFRTLSFVYPYKVRKRSMQSCRKLNLEEEKGREERKDTNLAFTEVYFLLSVTESSLEKILSVLVASLEYPWYVSRNNDKNQTDIPLHYKHSIGYCHLCVMSFNPHQLCEMASKVWRCHVWPNFSWPRIDKVQL